jgi:hypothetical protein
LGILVNVVQRVLTAAGVSPAASVQAATWEPPVSLAAETLRVDLQLGRDFSRRALWLNAARVLQPKCSSGHAAVPRPAAERLE